MTDQSIYLVRHGETAFNADGRLRGRADPDLNAAGLGQAKSLACAFASARTSIMVSSPLLRAVHGGDYRPKLPDRAQGRRAVQ
jgi:broad specificity phosphatase PhoE